MEHLHNALSVITSDSDFIDVNGSTVHFTVQDGPINDAGINGVQVTEILIFVKEVYKSLNNAFPCRENSITITKIEEAIHWQDARTKDRESRGVEGQNKD